MSRVSRIRLNRGGEAVAPVLSEPTGTETGSTTASGTVYLKTTSAYKEGGTLYYYTTTSTFQTRDDIIASGDTQTVTADGSQSVTITGLSASQAYYIHYAYTDFVETKSSVVVSATFTTEADGGGGDVEILRLRIEGYM